MSLDSRGKHGWRSGAVRARAGDSDGELAGSGIEPAELKPASVDVQQGCEILEHCLDPGFKNRRSLS